MCDPHTFISYNQQDKSLAEQICASLEAVGVTCWIAPRNIDPGADWASQIVEAIGRTDNFLVIISKNSLYSNEVLKELTLASSEKKRILAVCVDGCEPEGGFRYHLAISQRITLDRTRIDEAVKQLERKLHSEKQWEINQNPTTSEKSAIQKPVPSEDTAIHPSGTTVRIATYRDLVELGWDKHAIAARLVENDKNLYPHIAQENEGDVSQWEAYLSSYPQTFRYLINEKNQIIGNWSFVFLSGDDFQKQNVDNCQKMNWTFVIRRISCSVVFTMVIC